MQLVGCIVKCCFYTIGCKGRQCHRIDDNFAEERMINAHENGDEIHVFHREKHHSDFMYLGRATVLCVERETGRSSRFQFRID